MNPRFLSTPFLVSINSSSSAGTRTVHASLGRFDPIRLAAGTKTFDSAKNSPESETAGESERRTHFAARDVLG
jgi:hypothetical protein